MRPNILFITADQWRADALGAAGNPLIQTPVADRLAREGVLFRNHFAAAAPCAPARAALYTGREQANNRVTSNGTPLDDRFDTLARAARRAGYEPTLFGYTDVAPDPRRLHPADPALTSYEGVLPGFQVRQALPEHDRPWLSWLEGRGHRLPPAADVHRPVAAEQGEVTTAPPFYGADETQSAFLAGEFVRWHGEQDPDRPWFAHVSLIRPHPPFIVPAPYNTLHDPDRLPAPAGPDDPNEAARLHPLIAFLLWKHRKASFLPGHAGLARDFTPAERKILKAIYFGMVSEVDAAVGRMIDALERRGDLDRTLVVLTSDHGELMGDHCLFGKGGFLDGSFRIPLVIRQPGGQGPRGQAVAAFTSAVDLYPTLLEAMDLPAEAGTDGRSLMTFLDGRGPGAFWRPAVTWSYDFRDVGEGLAEAHFRLPSAALNLAVWRDGATKYVHFAGLPPLLFDLASDPGETVDLSCAPQARERRLAAAEALLSHRLRHLDQTLASQAVTPRGLVTRDPFALP